MAIYHLSVKTFSRSAGQSATAAAAYRSGSRIVDSRTGEIHDYERKQRIESSDLLTPAGAPEWAADRAAVWNAAEQAETRKNSTVAREFEVALPEELSPAERRRLAVDFARELVDKHQCAADVSIHLPHREGDERNHHAHILLTTRRLTPAGFGEKTRELDDMKTGPAQVAQWRERWAELSNERLRGAGLAVRVDHRSLAEQGVDREPTRHLGPAAVAYERRTGLPSRRRSDANAQALERLAKAKEVGELERQAAAVDRSILDLTGDLAAARRDLANQARGQVAAEPTRRPGVPSEAEIRAILVATSDALGAAAKVYPAKTTASVYRGLVVAQTAEHTIQAINSETAISHRKDLAGGMQLGKGYAVAYDAGRATVTEVPLRRGPTRGQDLGR